MEKLAIGAPELGTLARMLRGVDFFSPLTVGQMDQILPYIMLCSYAPGETVFKQGQPGDAFYIVYKGKVRIKVKKNILFSTSVAELGPGNFFGEIALISREPRTATVKCDEPTQLFVLVSGDFEFILKENPAAAREMAKIAARRRFNSSHLND